jgi:hypothetical protein
MTCEELRPLFEDPLLLDHDFPLAAQHLALCPACARFVEARRELRTGLRAIRESAPQLPERLDSAVLAHYRRHFTDALPPLNSNFRPSGFAWMGWGAAAAILLATALLFFLGRTTKTAVVRSKSSAHSSSPPQLVAVDNMPSAAHRAKPSRLHPIQRRRPRFLVPPFKSPGLASFGSLIYCDELSCGEAMEVIRVQLPASATPFMASSAAASSAVFADVVVGPDGIARAIRVVE